MKARLSFLYITCYNVNYFVSQPVGLDFASGSGLPVGLNMKTPWVRLPAVSCDLHTTMTSMVMLIILSGLPYYQDVFERSFKNVDEPFILRYILPPYFTVIDQI